MQPNGLRIIASHAADMRHVWSLSELIDTILGTWLPRWSGSVFGRQVTGITVYLLYHYLSSCTSMIISLVIVRSRVDPCQELSKKINLTTASVILYISQQLQYFARGYSKSFTFEQDFYE